MDWKTYQPWFRLARRLCLLPIALVVLVASLSAAEGNSSPFEEANRLFERGKHAEAAQAYERLVSSGQANATVYFNMGTAWLQAGRIGLAIDALIRARSLAPNDAEIANNLRIARLRSGAPVQESFVDLLSRLPLNAWTWLAGFGAFFWFILRASAEFRPATSSRLRAMLITTGSVTLLVAGGAAAVAWDQIVVRRVVVIAPEAVVRRGPLDESAAVFTPADGIELGVTAENDGWFKVRDVDGQDGWVLKNQVKRTIPLPTPNLFER
jgi:tetratricopeptide (TPR) repeat protein